MIYTVTLNPCLDYIVSVPDFHSGQVNRAKFDHLTPGGKGINVSYFLNVLKQDSLCLGFVAGFTGDEICRLMNQDGIRNDFIHLDHGGYSRIDVQMIHGLESSINGVGPKIIQEDMNKLCEQLLSLKDGDTLVLSGSIPRGSRDTIYGDIMRYLEDRNLEIVIDAKGPLLLNTLKYHPFLIKVNLQELTDIFYAPPASIDDIIRNGRGLQQMGARNVLITLGADGAVLVTESGEIYRHAAMEGRVRSTVSCGDSMLAGFIAGYSSTGDMVEAFRYSLAAASANAFSDGRGTYEEFRALLEQLHDEAERPR